MKNSFRGKRPFSLESSIVLGLLHCLVSSLFGTGMKSRCTTSHQQVPRGPHLELCVYVNNAPVGNREISSNCDLILSPRNCVGVARIFTRNILGFELDFHPRMLRGVHYLIQLKADLSDTRIISPIGICLDYGLVNSTERGYQSINFRNNARRPKLVHWNFLKGLYHAGKLGRHELCIQRRYQKSGVRLRLAGVFGDPTIVVMGITKNAFLQPPGFAFRLPNDGANTVEFSSQSDRVGCLHEENSVFVLGIGEINGDPDRQSRTNCLRPSGSFRAFKRLVRRHQCDKPNSREHSNHRPAQPKRRPNEFLSHEFPRIKVKGILT